MGSFSSIQSHQTIQEAWHSLFRFPTLRRLALPAPRVVVCVFIASCLLLLAVAPAALRYWFPGGAFIAAVLLYAKDRYVYIAFSWWLWFLTPFVRRLVCYRSNFVDQDPTLLAPVLVAAITAACLLRSRFTLREYFFVVPAAVLGITFVYSLIVGVSFATATLALLMWLTPVCFGLQIYRQWPELPRLWTTLRSVCLWGALVMGSYGVIQFFVGPAWDMKWVEDAVISQLPGISSVGEPFPMQFRVFSTMNSQQPFASTLVFTLLLIFLDKSVVARVASIVGATALLLTSARAAWIEYLLAIVLFVVLSRSGRQAIRVFFIVAALGVAGVALSFSPAGEQVSQRLNTLQEATSDSSYIARVSGYEEYLRKALTSPLGMGFGALDRLTKNQDADAFGAHDSTPIELMLTIGWFGTFCIVWIMYKVAIRSIGAALRSREPQLICLTALFCSMLLTSSLNSLVGGAPGMTVATVTGLLLAFNKREEQYFSFHFAPTPAR